MSLAEILGRFVLAMAASGLAILAVQTAAPLYSPFGIVSEFMQGWFACAAFIMVLFLLARRGKRA